MHRFKFRIMHRFKLSGNIIINLVDVIKELC